MGTSYRAQDRVIDRRIELWSTGLSYKAQERVMSAGSRMNAESSYGVRKLFRWFLVY